MSASDMTPIPPVTRTDRPPRGRRTVTARAAVFAACLAAAAGGLLVAAFAPAGAGATVSTGTPQYQQPPGILYTFQDLDSGSGATVLEDLNNETGNGAVVDTSPPVIVDQAGGTAETGPILQPSDQWAFIPAASNTGGSITTGYGELVNHQSGLCLDLNLSQATPTADLALVDQWQCVNGAQNEQFTATPDTADGGWSVQTEYDGAYLGNNQEMCLPDNFPGAENNVPVYLRTNGPSPCTAWQIQRVSYEFATNIIRVPGGYPDRDPTTYSCNVPGYTLRQGTNPTPNSSNGTAYYYPAYTNLSDDGLGNTGTYDEQVDIEFADDSSTPGPLAEPLYVHSNAPYWQNGQLLLYCDPNSTSP
jgi:hypothetical protein